MTVHELRNLTGEATAHLSDDELAEGIKQLDVLAEIYIKQVVTRKEVADKLEDK